MLYKCEILSFATVNIGFCWPAFEVSFSAPSYLLLYKAHICLTYYYPEDGGGMLLQNFIKHLQDYAVSTRKTKIQCDMHIEFVTLQMISIKVGPDT